jgi:hypothetical protein
MALDTQFVEDVISLVNGLSSVEKLSISQAIYEKNQSVTTFEDSSSHTIVSGIRSGNLIPIINNKGNVDSFPFNNADDCSIPECDVDFKIRTKKWELGLIECRVPICMRKFDQEFLLFFNGKKDVFGEDTNSALIRFITERVQKNLNLAKWRVAYFGDKTLASNLYNGFDGFFTQAVAEPENVINIQENDGADYAAQMAITGLDIYNYLVAMVEKMQILDMDESANQNFTFRMTKATARIFANYLNKNKDSECCDGVQKLNGSALASYQFDQLAFWNIPIIVEKEWDTIINESAVLNGGGGTNARLNPHRILLTYSDNLVVGTENGSDLDHFKIWYENKDHKIYIEAGAYLGAGIPLNDYVLAI